MTTICSVFEKENDDDDGDADAIFEMENDENGALGGEATYEDDDKQKSDEEELDDLFDGLTLQPLNITLTTRGGRKLCVERYYYTQETRTVNSKGLIWWKCERTTSCTKWVKCMGRASSKEHTGPVIISEKHNHDPDFEREAVLKCNTDIKKQAGVSNADPRNIINNCQSDLNSYEAAKCASDDALRQVVNRVRNAKTVNTKNPKDLAEFVMTEMLAATIKGVKFFYDSAGKENKYEIMMFATEDNIVEINKSVEWYGDGTFDVCLLSVRFT